MAPSYALLGRWMCIACGLVALGACQAEPPDIAQTLANDPERLKAILRTCKNNPHAAEDPLCLAASEAWRRRFFKSGAPHRVGPLPPPPVNECAPLAGAQT